MERICAHALIPRRNRMSSKLLRAAVAATFAALPLVAGALDEKRSTLENQEAVAVTIYNENLALIKDTRAIALGAGVNRLALREVSALIRPETAQLRSLTHPGAL